MKYATYDNPKTFRREWWVKEDKAKGGRLVKSFCGIVLEDYMKAMKNEPCPDKTWLPPFKLGRVQGDKEAITF